MSVLQVNLFAFYGFRFKPSFSLKFYFLLYYSIYYLNAQMNGFAGLNVLLIFVHT